MSNNRTNRSPSSLPAVAAGIAGLLLALSVFLPWLTPKAQVATSYASFSGMDAGALIGLTGIAAGILAVGLVFLPARGVKSLLHAAVGITALGVLVMVIFNGTLPLRSAIVRNYVNTGSGVYLYGLAGLALVGAGIAERPPSTRKSSRYAPAATVPVSPSWRPAPAPAALPRFCGGCGQPVKHGAAFCGTCGQTLPGAPAPPLAPFAATLPDCTNCGCSYSSSAAFCPACGTPVTRTNIYQAPGAVYQPAPPAYQYTPPPAERVSGAWWLLPIFFGVLGGIIAFFAVYKRRPGMAAAMLVLGAALSLAAFFLVRSAMSTLSGFGF